MDKTSIKLSDHLYNVSLGSQRREILQQLRSNGVKVRDYAKFGAVTAIAAVVIAVVVLIIVLT